MQLLTERELQLDSCSLRSRFTSLTNSQRHVSSRALIQSATRDRHIGIARLNHRCLNATQKKARRVIFFARYEASQFGSPYIETEHLLLGLLRESKVITAKLLNGSDSVEAIRRKVESKSTQRDKVSTSVDLPLSNESKRVLAYGAEEAERLGHKHIGTEHRLLGLLREKNSFGEQLLNQENLTLEKAREGDRNVGAGWWIHWYHWRARG